MPHAHLENELFPLNLLQEPPATRHATLQSVTLSTPIHVHTPAAHIGVVHGDVAGERTSALELIQFLHSLVLQPVNLQTTYDLLPHDTRMQVAMAFVQRVGYPPNTPGQHIILAPQPHGSIIGYDLLLGNNEVWGFEHVSFEGYSVIHLDRNYQH